VSFFARLSRRRAPSGQGSGPPLLRFLEGSRIKTFAITRSPRLQKALNFELYWTPALWSMDRDAIHEGTHGIDKVRVILICGTVRPPRY
jgi:hypothetical protein